MGMSRLLRPGGPSSVSRGCEVQVWSRKMVAQAHVVVQLWQV